MGNLLVPVKDTGLQLAGLPVNVMNRLALVAQNCPPVTVKVPSELIWNGGGELGFRGLRSKTMYPEDVSSVM